MEQDSEANNDEFQVKENEKEQLITPAQETDEIDRRANLDVTITRSNTFAASDNTIYGIQPSNNDGDLEGQSNNYMTANSNFRSIRIAGKQTPLTIKQENEILEKIEQLLQEPKDFSSISSLNGIKQQNAPKHEKTKNDKAENESEGLRIKHINQYQMKLILDFLTIFSVSHCCLFPPSHCAKSWRVTFCRG